MKATFILAISVFFANNCFSQNPIKEFENSGYYTKIQHTDTSFLLITTFNNEIVFQFETFDGFVDSIQVENLNNDNIPDFIIEDRYCDGTDIYGFISENKTTFKENMLLSFNAGDECEAIWGLSPEQIVSIKYKDIDGDGIKEILLYHKLENNQLVPIECSDTLRIK